MNWTIGPDYTCLVERAERVVYASVNYAEWDTFAEGGLPTATATTAWSSGTRRPQRGAGALRRRTTMR